MASRAGLAVSGELASAVFENSGIRGRHDARGPGAAELAAFIGDPELVRGS
jgi:hypothetical protein